MGTPSFAKAASFPVARAYYTAGRTLWKIDVKEWAFATVDATDVDPGLNIGSNNPTVVPGFFDKSAKGIKYTAATIGSGGSVRFYANSTGFTFVNFFRLPLFGAVGGLLQVQIVERRSATAEDVQLTKLNGKTFAINAPDTVTYDMDKTVVSAAPEASEGGVFAKVEAGTNHVVVSSHGTLEDKSPTAKICLWAAGQRNSFRVNDGNVASTFSVLKGKVTGDCVIWIGGCTMAQNKPWCKAAAKAAGCHLVAPVNYTTIRKFPKGNIDLLDRSLGPVVFPPDGGEPIGVNDFCSQQDKFQFVVPP
jgi:hypothetical protein